MIMINDIYLMLEDIPSLRDPLVLLGQHEVLHGRQHRVLQEHADLKTKFYD